MSSQANKHQDNDYIAPNEVIKAFEFFDKEGKGMISAEELKVMLKKQGNPLTEEQITQLFEESNIKKDEKINYKELIQFWEEQ